MWKSAWQQLNDADSLWSRGNGHVSSALSNLIAVLAKHSPVCAEISYSPGRRDMLIELGGDDLAEKLDILHGDDVIDHSVIRCSPSDSGNRTPTSCV